MLPPCAEKMLRDVSSGFSLTLHKTMKRVDVTTTLIREGDAIIAESTESYTIIVNGVKYKVKKGNNRILIN